MNNKKENETPPANFSCHGVGNDVEMRKVVEEARNVRNRAQLRDSRLAAGRSGQVDVAVRLARGPRLALAPALHHDLEIAELLERV